MQSRNRAWADDRPLHLRRSLREVGLVAAALVLAGSCIPSERSVGDKPSPEAARAGESPGPGAAEQSGGDAFGSELAHLFSKPLPDRTTVPDRAAAVPDRTAMTAGGTAVPDREVVGRSVEGRAIECITYGDGPDCVLIMATIHGDEDAGTPLVEHMIGLLAERPDLVAGRRIVLMPDVNPDGRFAQTRGNARGVDLNRNYPADNFQPSARHGDSPLSEPESRAIDTVLRQYQPWRIVSIHQPLNSRKAMIDFDGPGEALAAAMAAHTDIPVQRIGSRPGSLGSYAGLTLGIPIITLELPPEAKARSGTALWEKYGEMMTAAIMNGADGTNGAVVRALGD